MGRLFMRQREVAKTKEGKGFPQEEATARAKTKQRPSKSRESQSSAVCGHKYPSHLGRYWMSSGLFPHLPHAGYFPFCKSLRAYDNWLIYDN